MSTLAPASVSDAARPEMIDAGVIAKAANVNRATVRNWAKAGRIKSIQIGRTIRFPRSVLDDLLACKVSN